MTDMASNHGKITRVFPRRTAATPEDPYAFTGPPPCGELPDISEVHISVTFTYDMQKAERLECRCGVVPRPSGANGRSGLL